MSTDAVSGRAQPIYDEAKDSLEVLADLVEQGVMPGVEASDFRASLERIQSLAVEIGASRGE